MPPREIVTANEVTFMVRLTPRGGADGVAGVTDGVLEVRVAATPIDGAANEALLRMLARALRVPRTSLRLVGGRTARLKRVAATGVTTADLLARWPGLAV